MRFILAADIGGTKTLLQLSRDDGEILYEESFPSQDFNDFESVLTEFCNRDLMKGISIASACFAVAGPVSGSTASVTNLPWQLDAEQLQQQFQIARVKLCNDFEAVGYGIACLDKSDIETLQMGLSDDKAPRAVIGAGTGLGQAILISQAAGWKVLATEGGHVDFAPTDPRQIRLLEYLTAKFGHVSYERVVSGVGLATIYKFLLECEGYTENPELKQAISEGDAGAAISEFTVKYSDPTALEALDMFIQIYGAQAGNLALTVLPRGGLYLAGGIAAKNMARFKRGCFIDAFLDKGRMRTLLEKVPVYVVKQPKIGLMGARLLAL